MLNRPLSVLTMFWNYKKQRARYYRIIAWIGLHDIGKPQRHFCPELCQLYSGQFQLHVDLAPRRLPAFHFRLPSRSRIYLDSQQQRYISSVYEGVLWLNV